MVLESLKQDSVEFLNQFNQEVNDKNVKVIEKIIKFKKEYYNENFYNIRFKKGSFEDDYGDEFDYTYVLEVFGLDTNGEITEWQKWFYFNENGDCVGNTGWK